MSMARIWVTRRHDATFQEGPYTPLATWRLGVLQRCSILSHHPSRRDRHAHAAAAEPPAPSRRDASPRSHAPSRSHAATPRPHTAAWPHVAQSRATTPAHRQADGETAGRAQAPGLARPRTAPAVPTDAGMGDDRPGVRERRPDLYALPPPPGGHRAGGSNDRGGRV